MLQNACNMDCVVVQHFVDAKQISGIADANPNTLWNALHVSKGTYFISHLGEVVNNLLHGW